MPESKFKKFSTTNTKQQILDAYNELLEVVEEKKKKELKPEEVIKEKETKLIVQDADKLSNNSINDIISNLKSEFNNTLNKLDEQLENSYKQYETLKKAIEAKQNELKEVYDIEVSASTLAALIETYNLKKSELEDEIEQTQSDFEQEMTTKREAWEIEKKSYLVELKEKENEELKKRQREKDDYQYNFEKEKRQALDKLTEQKIALEKEIKEIKEKADKELTARESVIAASEKELAELIAKSASFDKEMDIAISKAVKVATEKLISDNKHKEELLQKEIDGERKLFQMQISALEKHIKEQNEQIQKLSIQLEKSYQQVQDIAIRAVDGSSKKTIHQQSLQLND